MGKFVHGFGPGKKGGWKTKYFDLSGKGRAVKPMRKRTPLGESGVLFQFPPGYDDGSGTLQYVKSGPFAGRVCYSSAKEAKEIAARYAGRTGEKIHFNPD